MNREYTYDELLVIAQQHIPGVTEGDPRICTREQFEAHLVWLKEHPVGSFDEAMERAVRRTK